MDLATIRFISLIVLFICAVINLDRKNYRIAMLMTFIAGVNLSSMITS